MTNKRSYLCGASVLAVLVLGLSAPAVAQTQSSADKTADVEEVVVTGSYIAGTREDSALPVDVIGVEDLKKQGAPTVVQLVKQITASTSGLGESNRYNGGAGTASINLRGFGASRTLTLMNGRRLSDSAQAAFQGGGADLNFIPQAAIGRIEILKDGAAATYGSEAIGGVVNFITRKDLEGFEIIADYSAVQDTNGEYRGSVAYGKKWANGNLLLTAGYRHRSRLDAQDRDWAVTRFESANYGGWSANSNPGNYQTNNAGNSPASAFLFRDNGCNELGGQLTSSAVTPTGTINVPVSTAQSTSASTCRFQFTNFNDIVNKEDHYQLYGEVNIDITDDIRFHGEAAWNRNSTPNQRISPANGNTLFPTPTSVGGLSGTTQVGLAPNFSVRYNLPGNNPGLLDITGQTPGSSCAIAPTTIAATTTPAAVCAQIAAAGLRGVDISQTAFRFIANAGFPGHKDGADYQQIQATAYRISGGLSGNTWHDIHWDTNLTYMKTEAVVNTNDLLVNKVQAALNGWGSRKGAADQCTVAERTLANAGNAAVGCFFFNPMTNAIPVSATNGATNPFYRGAQNPAVINNQDVLRDLYGNYTNMGTAEIFVAEVVFSGDLPITLPGGTVQMAAGAQYRYNRDTTVIGDLFNNKVNPCVDSIDDGIPVCGAPSGPLIFFGSGANTDFKQDVTAGFAEIRVPVFDTLEVTGAVRYEKFSNGLDTTNPKLSVKWQALDFLAFRGTAGTTFRAPSAGQITSNCAVGVANLGGTYRGVQTCGNPALKPETADAYSVGGIFQKWGFNVTLDYYLFKFKGELTTEGASNLFAAMFPATPAVTDPAHPCNNPAFAPLKARFTFSSGCSATNLLRIDTFTVNGPPTETSGFDFRASYDWDGFFDANYQVGVEATYLKKYQRGAFSLFGAPSVVFAAPFDRAGTHDLQSAFFSYPKTRANFWINAHRENVNVRYQMRYAEGTRAAINTANDRIMPDASQPLGFSPGTIGKLKDYYQHDLTVQVELPWETQLTLSVQNILDKDPPDAPSNYNYDYTTGNPLGRVFEVGVKKRF